MRTRFKRGALRSPGAIGIAVVGAALLAWALAYSKEAISSLLTSGETLSVQLRQDDGLIPNSSEVKMAGVPVGLVTDVQKGRNHDVSVEMKVNDDIRGKLGSSPSAAVRPTTLLGGKYFIELTQGGRPGSYDDDTIPANRTRTPVELGKVLQSFPGSARQGIQTTTRQLDATLANGGREALGAVLRDAPGTLAPAGPLLDSLRGDNPQRDLSGLVTNLDKTSAALTRNDGQLADTLGSLDRTTGALAAARQPLADTVDRLPDTLRVTRAGLNSLDGPLDRLGRVAGNLRPTAAQLGPALANVNRLTGDARPVVSELRPLLAEARPMVDELVPTARQATGALDNVRGPVLDRVNGPIVRTVLSPWTGTGAYAGDGGNGNRFYEEVGYLAAHSAKLSWFGDHNGAMVGLNLGVGTSTPQGAELPFAKFLEGLGAVPPGTIAQPPAGSVPAPADGPANSALQNLLGTPREAPSGPDRNGG